MSKHTTRDGAKQPALGRKDSFRGQQRHHPSRLEPQKQKTEQKSGRNNHKP